MGREHCEDYQHAVRSLALRWETPHRNQEGMARVGYQSETPDFCWDG